MSRSNKAKKMNRKNKKFFLGLGIIGLITILGLILLRFFPSVVSDIYHIPFVIFDIKSCEPPKDFYINEQVVYDSSILEGTIERIQDKKPGQKRDCWHYKTESQSVEITVNPTPSIIKIGTKKFKDPYLLAEAKSAGIRESLENEPISLYYVDTIQDFSWSSGLYDIRKKTIMVKKNSNRSDEHITFAHEYLHYVWFRDELEKDQRLVNELTSFYHRSSSLKIIMSEYPTKAPTEFFSYGCTDWQSQSLTKYILQKCNQYIDRSKLSLFFYD